MRRYVNVNVGRGDWIGSIELRNPPRVWIVDSLAAPNTTIPNPQWCGPCQLLAGEMDKVAGLYKDKLRVLKVDSDEEPRIASALKVYGLPTIFFIKARFFVCLSVCLSIRAPQYYYFYVNRQRAAGGLNNCLLNWNEPHE